jgi:hypothetical protein
MQLLEESSAVATLDRGLIQTAASPNKSISTALMPALRDYEPY